MTKPATRSSPAAQYQPPDGLRLTGGAVGEYVVLLMLIDDLQGCPGGRFRMRGVDRLSYYPPSATSQPLGHEVPHTKPMVLVS
jgi:hypothetical protein